MSNAASIMMWAQRVCARRNAKPHELLEIAANATIDDAQQAFHRIARIAHPDLHRNALAAEELEMLTAAYSIVAGAYQSYRQQAMQTTRIQPIRDTAPPPVTPSGPAPAPNAAQAMSAKALLYYRKAELALKRGDLKGAILQIKLAIAADPQSAFLRTALVEVEAEVGKAGGK